MGFGRRGRSVHLGQAGKALGQVVVGGDVVVHLPVVELLIGHHVKIAGAGEAEDNGLLLPGLFALEGLVDGHPDGVAGLGGGEDALHPGKVGGRLKDLGLLHTGGLNEAVVVELADHRAHAVVPQAAGVVGRGDEAGAQGVHLGQGADHARVAEVIGELAPGEAGAGGGLHGDDPVVGLPPELLPHKGGDETAQVGENYGEPYILLAQMYGSNPNWSDEPALNRCTYYVVIDKLQRAKAVDPSVTDKVNELIATYARHTPQAKDLFMLGYKAGDRITIGGWIGESTTIR